MITLADAETVIRRSYHNNSPTTSTDAAYLILGDWGVQCGQVRALTAEHAAATARLIAERDTAVAERDVLRKALLGPLAELNRIVGGE